MKNRGENDTHLVMILDTSAFVAGYDPFTISQQQFTTPAVVKELRADNLTTMRFKAAVESNKIKILVPSQTFLQEVKASAASAGDAHCLSETDFQLLALALELKNREKNPKIITDDYSIQNVATQLGLDFLSLATFGIRRIVKWVRYCPACRKMYPPNFNGTTCTICATRLKRKPLRKQNLQNSR